MMADPELVRSSTGVIVSSIKNETSWLCSAFAKTAFRPVQRSQAVLEIIELM
jgi:hypothetical protein